MIFNDGNQWHFIVDINAYMRERNFYEMRACSARNNGRDMYVDEKFKQQQKLCRDNGLAALWYQFPYQNAGTPEQQADFFLNAVGNLLPNERVMLDTEGGSGLASPTEFALRWFAVVEKEFNTIGWIYVPQSLSSALSPAKIGNRITKAPRYASGDPYDKWGPTPTWAHDIHQYSQNAYFPGANGPGDSNFSKWSLEVLLARSTPQSNVDDDDYSSSPLIMVQ
jgi:hypothetical protein